MGKKKIPKKTKDLSVAVAETSSPIIGEQISPRKRGRPRKIVEKKEEVKESKEESQQDSDEEHESKKQKSNEELVKVEEARSSTCTNTIQDQPRRSRRKSKPRKSC
ncbi:hypothetical protein Hanom_Chr12g01160221 [Helianthus anomalus]